MVCNLCVGQSSAHGAGTGCGLWFNLLFNYVHTVLMVIGIVNAFLSVVLCL